MIHSEKVEASVWPGSPLSNKIEEILIDIIPNVGPHSVNLASPRHFFIAFTPPFLYETG